MNESEEIKKLNEERKRLTEKLAYETLVANGEKYLTIFGPEKLKNDIDLFRAEFYAWNRIAHASISLNIQSIDIMLQVLCTLPMKLGMPNLVLNERHSELVMVISAMRNYFMKERDEKIKKSNMELSP